MISYARFSETFLNMLGVSDPDFFRDAMYWVVKRNDKEILYIVNFVDGKNAQDVFYASDIDRELNRRGFLFFKIESNMPYYQFFRDNKYTYIKIDGEETIDRLPEGY